MPYIDKNTREFISDLIDFDNLMIADCGELNYMLTKICINYMDNHGVSYQTCNDIVGALDNAKDEFRRRIQHPYETIKMEKNGDCYLQD